MTRRLRLSAWGALTAAYVALALWAVDTNVVMGDTLSRLANASYAVRSGDPHVSAIGFVWSPLPSLGLLAPVRYLTEASAQTRWSIPAVATALTTVVLLHRLRALVALAGAPDVVSIVVLVGIAANPLVLFFAVNGMTEAFFLVLCVQVTLAVVRYLETDATHALAAAGLWLAVAYLVRYEAVAATAGTAGFVGLVAAVRAFRKTPSFSGALAAGTADGVTVAVPAVTSFLLLAVVSWVVTGHPFEQLTSVYGNTSVVADTVDTGMRARLAVAATQAAALAPLALPAAVVALFGPRRSRHLVAAAGAVFGSVLGFTAVLQATGKTLPFLRFWMPAVPLGACLLAAAAATFAGRWRTGVARVAVVVAVAVAVLLGGVTTAAAMADDSTGVQEHHLLSLASADRDRRDERATLRGFQAERRAAAWIDGLQLARGHVLTDVLLAFAVVAASENPTQFVIPSDRGFVRAVADPPASGVRFLLTVPPGGRGQSDALNRAWAGIHEGRVGGLVLVAQFDGEPGDPSYRLWRVTGTLVPPA